MRQDTHDRRQAVEERAEGASGGAAAGLVTSAISAPTDLGAMLRFPSAALVGAAAACWPEPSRRVDGLAFSEGVRRGESVEVHQIAPGSWPRIEIGPGIVRFARVDVERRERSSEKAWEDEWADVMEAVAMAARGEEAPAALPTRGRIVRWSNKSRASMIATISTLDLAPLLEEGRQPGMVTLTMPGEWEELAPTAAAAAGMFHRFDRAYRKAWGPMQCVWKREFQRRGAPHWHLWMVPPLHRVKCDRREECGCDFRLWLRYAWATAMKVEKITDESALFVRAGVSDADEWVEHEALPDRELGRSACSCSEWCRSINAGTNVDYADALAASDPRRLALYFLKESLGGEDKAYQNAPPAIWGVQVCDVATRAETTLHASVGRFWGVRGIEKALEVVQVDPEHQYRIWRQLKKLREEIARPGRRDRPRPPATRTVWVDRVNARTGVVRRRKVTRRMRTSAIAGWVAVNDGAAVGANLGRFASWLADEAARAEPVRAHVWPDAASGFWGEAKRTPVTGRPRFVAP